MNHIELVIMVIVTSIVTCSNNFIKRVRGNIIFTLLCFIPVSIFGGQRK